VIRCYVLHKNAGDLIVPQTAMEPAQEHHELSNKRECNGERSRAQQAHRGLNKEFQEACVAR